MIGDVLDALAAEGLAAGSRMKDVQVDEPAKFVHPRDRNLEQARTDCESPASAPPR